jgi:hypothetical protein
MGLVFVFGFKVVFMLEFKFMLVLEVTFVLGFKHKLALEATFVLVLLEVLGVLEVLVVVFALSQSFVSNLLDNKDLRVLQTKAVASVNTTTAPMAI